MKITSTLIARALLSARKGASAADEASLMDAALDLMRMHGLGNEIRVFPRLVRHELIKTENIAPVRIESPSGGMGPALKPLIEALERHLHKTADVEEIKNPALIGGVRIAFGDERLDMSVRASLDSFASHLAS